MPLAFLDGPYKLAMGLRALAVEDWLWLDQDHAAETALKCQLSASKREIVYRVMPGHDEAARETAETVLDWLLDHAPSVLERDGPRLRIAATGETLERSQTDPLLAAGCLVQEDLCVLSKGEDGVYRLVAGHLCFPLHWKLEDKLGQPLASIHGPVPALNARLASPMDKFFAALAVDRPVWRSNWTLTSTDELHLPDRRDHLAQLEPGEAGQLLWLRVERQTLRRLPLTGAVVFGIRSMRQRLDDVAKDPAVVAALAERIAELPDEMARYKGLLAIRQPLLAWLRQAATDRPKQTQE